MSVLPTPATPRSFSAPAHASQAPRHRERAHGGGIVVRWSALALGSTVGIGLWTALFVSAGALALGADALARWAGLDFINSLVGRTLVATYGCIAAAVALAAGSYVACRCGGARDRTAAVIYGLCMWSMATVAMALLGEAGLRGLLPVGPGPIASAVYVGLQVLWLNGDATQGTYEMSLWAMVAAMAISLVLAIRGAVYAVSEPLADERA